MEACKRVSETMDINHVEAGTLMAKAVKTMEEKDMLEKYDIKTRYKLDEVTFVDVLDYRNKNVANSYYNVLACQDLSDIMDEETKIERMIEARDIMGAAEYPIVNKTLQERMEYIHDNIDELSELKSLMNNYYDTLSSEKKLEYTELLQGPDNLLLEFLRSLNLKEKETLRQLENSLKGVSDRVLERALDFKEKTRISEEIKPQGNTPHISERIKITKHQNKYKKLMHTINILRIFGFDKWLPSEDEKVNLNGAMVPPPLIITSQYFRTKLLEVYNYMKTIKGNGNDSTFDKLPEIVKEDTEEKNEKRIRDYINILLMNFYLKILKCGKGSNSNYYLSRKWEKGSDNTIRLIK